MTIDPVLLTLTVNSFSCSIFLSHASMSSKLLLNWYQFGTIRTAFFCFSTSSQALALPLQAAILYLLDEKLDANWYGLRRKLSPPHVGTTGIYWIGMEGCKRSVSPREWAKSRLGKQSSRLFQDCAASKIKGMTFIRLLDLQKIFSHAWYRIEIKWRRRQTS